MAASCIRTKTNPVDITVSSGTTVSGVNFGNFSRYSTTSICGYVFNDLNGNGIRDTGEPGLQGFTVFLDTNNNGLLDAGEPSTVTDANGNFSFTNLATGTYRVREVTPAGFMRTTANPVDITVSSGTTVSGVNFGNFSFFASNSISGQVFNDLNGNGIKDSGEPGLQGVTVFLDTNNNGTLDVGEASTVSDVNGNFSFT